MAVSSAVRLLQIFAGLGSVATTPLTVQLANKHKKQVSLAGERTISESRAPEEIIKPAEEELKDLKQGEVMAEVKKMLGDEKGEPRCAWLPNQEKGLEFLVCVYGEELEKPFLFHYDLRNQLGKGIRVKQVESITFGLSPSKIKFKNEQDLGVKGITKLYLTTLFRQKSTTLTPEKDCKIVKNLRNYQFSCIDSNKRNQVEVGKVDLVTLLESQRKTLTR